LRFGGGVKRLLFAGLVLCTVLAGAAGAQRPLRLERVEITGNHRTAAPVVLRHLALEPGDAIDTDILEAARTRLVLTGYFKSVDFSTRPGTERGDVVLNVALEERGNPVFETGFGYNDLNGWFLTLLGVRFDNSLGADSQLRFGLRLGFRMIGIDGEWRKPISTSGRLALNTRAVFYGTNQLFYQSSDDSAGRTSWDAYRQDIGRAGLEATLQYAVDEAVRLEFGLATAAVDPDSAFHAVGDAPSIPGPLPDELLPDTRKATITGLVLRAFRDTRNSDVYPTRGSFLRATLNANGDLGGRAQSFAKATIEARRHLHIHDGWVLSSRLGGGVTSRGTPYYERFLLGGNYSVRGFSPLSLSPTGGDDAYWLVNEEIRWPLAGAAGRPRVVGLAFVDAGQGVRHGETIEAGDIDVGAGYGVRVLLPWVGTLGMDVGIPLTDGGTDERFRVHLLLGFSF
jgi:outer membrane protein insertion porin family